jgi:hypothetical protein
MTDLRALGVELWQQMVFAGKYHVAVHEAGHVVAALYMEQPIRYATLRPASGRLAGHVVYRQRRANQQTWERAMVAGAAGMIAEDLFCDQDPNYRPQVVRAGRSDLHQIRHMARYIVGCTELSDLVDDERPFLPTPRPGMGVADLAAEAWVRAVRLVFAQWRAVAAVAGALADAKRAISARDLAAIAESGEPPWWIAPSSMTRWRRLPRWERDPRPADLEFWPAKHSRLIWEPAGVCRSTPRKEQVRHA